MNSDSNILVVRGAMTAIQVAVAARLNDVFGKSGWNLQAIHEQSKDINFELQALIDKSGIAVIVLTPGATNPAMDAPGPIMDVVLTVQVTESPLTNSTGIPASLAAEMVAAALHHQQVDGMALVWKSIVLAAAEESVVYNVVFATSTVNACQPAQ